MPRQTQIRLALVVILIGAALLGRPTEFAWSASGWPAVIALVAFGAFNALAPAPGTQVVRAIGYGLAVVALGVGPSDRAVLLLLACFVYPPAFLIAWSLARNAAPRDETGDPELGVARNGTAAAIVSVAIASVVYRSISGGHVQQTSVLFVGIPALLALLVVYGASPTSAIGVACKAVTIGLLVSLIFLWEGALCVVMAAPLFYAVAIAVASLADAARKRDQAERRPLYSSLLLLVLAPATLEGVTNFTSLNREERVSATRIVAAGAADVERALFAPPRFDRARVLPLRAGFPMATASRIEHGADATRWVITVRGGEMFLNGMEPRTGELVLQLAESRSGFMRWRAVSDSSHMTHFLRWRGSEVRWEPVDTAHTRVTWTLAYRRDLDPAWYFGPWERYVARLAAGALIDMVATP